MRRTVSPWVGLIALAVTMLLPGADLNTVFLGAPDRQLLLGLFGFSEVHFLLQRIEGSWRVEPQSWLPLLLR